MAERSASATARGVAMLRAAHQLIDGPPPILDDPIIARLLGDDVAQRIRADAGRLQSTAARSLRSHVLLRSRVAEDALRDAIARGATQYALLGAGLDTFAYRQPAWARSVEIIEVDHPSSQAEKRGLLEQARIQVPPNVRYLDIDFEHETLVDGLRRGGVSFERVTVFAWLGVTMYLTREAIDAVLRTVASFSAGSELVLTFAQPLEPDEERGRLFAERAAAAGEPWISYFQPAEIEGVLRSHGFSDVRFLTRAEAMEQYYVGRRDGLLPPRRISIASATV